MDKKLILIGLLLAAPVHLKVWAATTDREEDASQVYLRALILESQGNLEGAEESLKKAAELAPQSGYIHAAAAEIAFRLGHYPLAAEYIKKALELDPEQSKNFVLAGQIYWAQGDNKSAEEMLHKAVTLSPDDAEPLIYLAMAVTPRDPQQAIKLYEDYLTRHPGETELRDRVAQLYQSVGEMDKAKASWEKVLEWDPESMKGHLALAQIAEVDSDTATAISHYQAVLDQDPTNLPLLLRIGELRYRTNSMAEARDAFLKAHAIAPESAAANFWLALLSEYNGDWKKAIELLERVRARSNDPGVLLRLSYYYSQDGQKKKAIKILEDLAASDPNNTDFMTYLALAYEEGREYKKAEKVLLKLSTFKSSDPEIYFYLATLYDKMNQFLKTEAMLKKALEIKPDYAMALNYLGYSYADRNMKLDEAETLLNHAVSLSPASGAYLDSLGWLYYRQGKYQKAEDFLQQAIAQTKDPLIFDHLGDSELALGNVQEAVGSWDESLRLDPKQKKVSGKIKKAILDLSDKRRMELFNRRTGQDYGRLESLKGLIALTVCAGKPCFDGRVQFSYEKGKELRGEIPGPLSGPVLLLVKPAGKPSQYGTIHPLFQSYEPLVRRAFDNLSQVLSGEVFSEVEGDALAENLVRSGADLEGESGEVGIIYDRGSGRLRKIYWKEGDAGSSLKFSSYKSSSALDFPEVMDWQDKISHFSIRFRFVSPVIQFGKPQKAEESDE